MYVDNWWLESAVPPTVTASMMLARAVRPVRFLQLPFPFVLLTGAWFNTMGATTEAAGITASWSGVYIVASRGFPSFREASQKSLRGMVRTGTIAMCWMNLLGGGYVHVKKYGWRLP